MVKFLVIGDFNAVLKKSLMKKVEKEIFDAVLTLGDYGGDKRIGRLIFKNWGKDWREVAGKKKTKQLLKEDYQKASKILKWLNSLKTPVFFIFGNNDQYKTATDFDYKRIHKDLLLEVKKLKNLKYVHNKSIKFKGINIYGHGGFVVSDTYLRKGKAYDKKALKKRKKEYEKDKKLLLKPKKIDILLIHYPPYRILDKIDNPLVKTMHGKPVGFKPYNLAIKKFKPKLVFCSHMEEHSQKKKIYGKSLIVNPGSALLGDFSMLEFNGKRNKLKFFK